MSDTIHTHLALAPQAPGPLATAGDGDPYTTELVDIDANGVWLGPSANADIQILVTAGHLSWNGQELGQGSFIRFDWTEGHGLGSGPGCRLLIKTGPISPVSPGTSVGPIDPSTTPWSPGQGNLRVLPLDSRQLGSQQQESTALVHWPVGERFLPHRHFGGEEIFVLSGTFRDEHGSYPAGTWIQSPHGSVHHPFVKEETRIWVKTGHLPPG